MLGQTFKYGGRPLSEIASMIWREHQKYLEAMAEADTYGADDCFGTITEQHQRQLREIVSEHGLRVDEWNRLMYLRVAGHFAFLHGLLIDPPICRKCKGFGCSKCLDRAELVKELAEDEIEQEANWRYAD